MVSIFEIYASIYQAYEGRAVLEHAKEAFDRDEIDASSNSITRIQKKVHSNKLPDLESADWKLDPGKNRDAFGNDGWRNIVVNNETLTFFGIAL